MEFVKFSKEHIEEAKKIALEHYKEEMQFVSSLPKTAEIPELDYFAENGFGVAALENQKLVGYLCCFEPRKGIFDMFDGIGVYSPLFGNGAIKQNRKKIYQDMFEYFSKNWATQKIQALGITLYAHDNESKMALFEYGFGMRCKDSVRLIDNITEIKNKDLTFEELSAEDFPKIRDLRKNLDNHLKEAPCFMQSTKEEFQNWLKEIESDKERRTFVAKEDGKIVAYLDVAEEGENFISCNPKMHNIHGAYCLPEYRGQGIYSDLLNYVISILKQEDFEYLGVDFESYNPTANRFWKKHFEEYTNSVVRKIENWAFN